MNSAPANLFGASYEDAAVVVLFDDAAWVCALVRVEVALTRAEAQAGVVPAFAGVAIAERAASFSPDIAKLAAASARDGFPIIGLVEQLRAHVGPDAADFVHWGATTQDILDTALVMQLAAALRLIEERLARVSAALAALADRHRRTLMVGRTHLQPALPTTFGLTAVNWLAPLIRHRRRLAELRPRLLVVQCGGAAGTLASVGDKGPAVTAAFASELGLGVPVMPWQTQRDNILEVAGWLALVGGSAAKFAHDVLLLAQAEVGEVRESGGTSRGGSSAMPQKSNPVTCENIIVAARNAEAHRAALGLAYPPEHQRGTVTGQWELLHVPRLCASTGGALRAVQQLASELVVDVARMKSNLDATYGVVLAEAVTLALREHMPADDARSLVREACVLALERKRHVIDLLRVRTNAPIDWDRLHDENNYLGSADRFIEEVLADAAKVFPLCEVLTMNEVVIVSAVRTPIARIRGALAAVRPDDLAGHVIRAAVERAGVAPDAVEEVYFGCANQAGEDNRNIARMGALLAGLPHSVAGITLNRLCTSGLSAINHAARAIRCGDAEVLVAGGVESMTRAPYSVPKNPQPFGPSGNVTAWDTALGWRYPNPRLEMLFPLEAMGETAENIYELSREGKIAGGEISRVEQDRFALQSHTRAVAALNSGAFQDELVSVPVPQSKGEPVDFAMDELAFAKKTATGFTLETSQEKLAKLAPAFRKGGTVTAGNSSSLSDGASALVLMAEKRASALGLKPLSRWVGAASAGVDPRVMGLGPVPAVRRLLGRTGVEIRDLELVELNEAFAVQALAVMHELGLSEEITNIHGGAIALGHPLGCSGARIMTTLIHALCRRAVHGDRKCHGLAALCAGVGQGEATLIEGL